MSWKLRVFPIFRSNYENNLDRNIDPRERPKFSRHYVYKNNISVSNYIDWITQHLDSDLTEVKADNSVEDFSDEAAEDDKNNADDNDADDVAAEPVKYNPKQVKRFCKLPADSENNDWADYTEINGSIKGKEKGDKVLRKLVTCLIQMQKVSQTL